MKITLAVATLSLALLALPGFAHSKTADGVPAFEMGQSGAIFAAGAVSYGPGEGRQFRDGIG